MKYHLALCCVIAAISVIAQPTQNLEAYYPFNGNMDDESGNNHHGTHGPPGVFYGAGSYFTSDRWSNPNAACYAPYTFIENSLVNDISSDTRGTWSAWISPGKMPPSPSSHRSIVSFGSNTDYDWISLRLEKNGLISASAHDGTLTTWPPLENLLWEVTTDSQVVFLLEWVHVALVHDGVSPKLYINGSEVPQTVNPSSLDQSAWIHDFDSLDNVVIGSSRVYGGGDAGGFFEGIIDDVRIYSSDLSASQIQDLYNEEDPNPKPDWKVKDSLAYYSDGPVGVGIDSVGTHMLAVDGSIGAREIVVESSGWSDYVFEEGYQLLDIKDLEEFIQKNNHLPGVPPESQMLENGINVSEMNAKLLEKIEELTLYIIQQNKTALRQEERIKVLEEKLGKH